MNGPRERSQKQTPCDCNGIEVRKKSRALGMTVSLGFSADSEAPPLRNRGEEFGLATRVEGRFPL